MTELSIAQSKKTSQIALKQDTMQESATYVQTETWLLKNQATEFEKKIDIANTLLARDYKGFGNQPMNTVVELR